MAQKVANMNVKRDVGSYTPVAELVRDEPGRAKSPVCISCTDVTSRTATGECAASPVVECVSVEQWWSDTDRGES